MLDELKEKYVFFDVDGTLAPYRFNDRLNGGEYGCQSLSDFLFGNLFEENRPFNTMQNIIKQLDSSKIFILGACETNNEIYQKYRWLEKHYPQFKQENVIFVSDTSMKPKVIIEYAKKLNIDISQTAFVDDRIEILRDAEQYGINAYHISSFII